jgi:hypothetical protein
MPKVFDSSSSAVGAVQSAMITEAQFQAQFGTGWVLADGRSVAGSKYASITGSANIPDLRGMVLRGKNNGRVDGKENPDGDSSLGTYQSDEFKSHYHIFSINYNSGALSGAQGNTPNAGANTFNGNTDNSGGNETRMKNVTVNYFIRIN